MDIDGISEIKGDVRTAADRLGLTHQILTDDAFAEKSRRLRRRTQIRWLVVMGLMDIAALAVDRIAIGSWFSIGFILRFGLVLPLVVVALALHRWSRNLALQSAATGAATVAFVAMIAALAQWTHEPFPSRYMLVGQWFMFSAILFAGLPWRLTKTMAIVGSILFSIIAVTGLQFAIVPVNIDLAVLCFITSYLALSIRRRTDLQHAELVVMRRIDNARELELRRANDNLSRLSRTDALTGVFNRRYLDEYIRKAATSLAPLSGCGVLMIDVDHFKLFNDSAGHLEGDRCLREVAQGLGRALRSGDLLARYGGEEFAVVLPDADLRQTLVIAEKLRRAVNDLKIANPALGPEACVSVSIGASFAASTEDLADSVARADAALYAAKQNGRNQVSAGETLAELRAG